MSISIHEVKSGGDLRKFIDFPHALYKDDPYYVPELFMAQKDLLNPRKNPFFNHASMVKYLAIRDGKVLGRIAAIKNDNHIEYSGKSEGFFGFFDCINDEEVSSLLLTTARDWLKEKGLSSMMGPANPSTNDPVGTLIEGFHDTPSIMTTYNKPYYKDLLSAFGLQKEMDLLAYELKTMDVNQRSVELASKLEERLKSKGIHIRRLNKKNFSSETEHVLKVYKEAWASNWGFVPPTDDEFRHGAKDLKMILDEDFAYVAEHEGKAVGMVITLPDINHIIKDIPRGRLFPFGWFRLLFQQKKIRRVRIMVLGVIPSYRKMGLEAIFYSKMIVMAIKKGYLNGEASWILENNELMNKGLEKLNGTITKRYRLYSMSI